MVIVFADHAAVTPAGNPDATPIPVPPVVVWVMFVSAVLIHSVGVEEGAVAVLFGITVTEILDVLLTHPVVLIRTVSVAL